MWTPTGSTFSMLQTVMALPLAVAHDLILDLFPARDALLDQDLMHAANAGCRSRAISRSSSSVVGNAAARAAEGIGRTDDDRHSRSRAANATASSTVCRRPWRGCTGSPIFSHRVLEQLRGPPPCRWCPAWRPAARRRISSRKPLLAQLHGKVQAGLAAKGGQHASPGCSLSMICVHGRRAVRGSM